VVPAPGARRADVFIAQHWPDLTRTRAEKLIKAGRVRADGQVVARPKQSLSRGQTLVVEVPEAEPTDLGPEVRPLDVRYEDGDLLVINKPCGLIVHPGGGVHSGTLVNALLAYCSDLSGVGGRKRPGIVHRLDKDTSGLMLVAKNDRAHLGLSRQIQARTAERRYQALVWGAPPDRFAVEVPIGRRPGDRKRMAALPEGVTSAPRRAARTEFELRERFRRFALLEARLLTGRTHQVRVHLSYRGFPVVGDLLYGHKRAKTEWSGLEPELQELIEALPGQALHAYRIAFDHPRTGERITVTAEPPAEMAALLAWLRDHDMGGSDVSR
jgi:23S rRNA pseudouridine1911/1915/1917 synthase